MNEVTEPRGSDVCTQSHRQQLHTQLPQSTSMNADRGQYLSPTEARGAAARSPAADTNGGARTLPAANGKTADLASEPHADGVSPELIAAITDRVKKELVEHLKQTGSIDGKAPPLQRVPSNKSSSTSSPPPPLPRLYTPPSPSALPKSATFPPPPTDTLRSPPGSPLEKPGTRYAERPQPRPFPTPRTYSTMELSTVDQKWGRLFDHEGNPTQRLGQFLRGLANHIVDEFMPRRSIVITPTKMAAFYATHFLDKEAHPFVAIFGGHSDDISLLYQDLGCQHHLVQESTTTRPTVPGLTPAGFAHWMTIQTLAYPTEEARRLEKVVLAVPIDADGPMVDGKPERLPKQISRHLLPEKEDRKSRKLFDNAIIDFLQDATAGRRPKHKPSPSSSREGSGAHSHPPPPTEPVRARTSPINPPAKPIERERMPYAGAPSTSDLSINDEAVKIERDRQPYAAQPGAGRTYNDNGNLDTPKMGRANSTGGARSPSAPTRPRSATGSHHGPMRARSPTGSHNGPTTRDASAAASRRRSPSASARQPESKHKARAQSNASQNYPPPPRVSTRREKSPPFKQYSASTPVDINVNSPHLGGNAPYGMPVYPKTGSSNSGPSQSSYAATAFPPPPGSIDRDKDVGRDTMPRDIPGREREREKHRDRDAAYRRPTVGEEDSAAFRTMGVGEFQSPRDAERWDRIQDLRSGEGEYGSGSSGRTLHSDRDRDRGRDRRTSFGIDAREPEYYRDRDRGRTYGGYDR